MESELPSLAFDSRRAFLKHSAIGTVALAQLLGIDRRASAAPQDPVDSPAVANHQTHFAPMAKRVIYLFQSGGPSQLELMDYKPKLKEYHGTELPESIRNGQRLTGMTSGQKSFPVVAPKFQFHQVGSNGAWFSELLPHTGAMADDLCIVRSMNTEAINHDPAITFMQTGSQQPGRPSLGSWLRDRKSVV